MLESIGIGVLINDLNVDILDDFSVVQHSNKPGSIKNFYKDKKDDPKHDNMLYVVEFHYNVMVFRSKIISSNIEFTPGRCYSNFVKSRYDNHSIIVVEDYKLCEYLNAFHAPDNAFLLKIYHDLNSKMIAEGIRIWYEYSPL